jgi:hypothetical protein
VNKGTIISLAWPETRVIREGKWYDNFTRALGFIDGEHYIAGHAACVLVEHKSGDVHYFDFGRYHTPFHFGRVRSAFTDPELKLITKCKMGDNSNLQNIDQLLFELINNPSTHGDGTLYASEYHFIDFEKTLKKAESMQQQGVIAYGPIKPGGTNCSRFVARLTLDGGADLITSVLLRFPYTVSPTPRSNTRIINNTGKIYKVLPQSITCFKTGFNTLFGLFSNSESKLSSKPISI